MDVRMGGEGEKIRKWYGVLMEREGGWRKGCLDWIGLDGIELDTVLSFFDSSALINY